MEKHEKIFEMLIAKLIVLYVLLTENQLAQEAEMEKSRQNCVRGVI